VAEQIELGLFTLRRPEKCAGSLLLPHLRAEHPLVAGHTSWVLFISAKNLLVEAQAPKPFDLDRTFEPGVRNRRPTIDVGSSEDARSIMSDEFDSLDAIEKAAVGAAL
jgi:hypothetical protein